jgi:hypothetical protein
MHFPQKVILENSEELGVCKVIEGLHKAVRDLRGEEGGLLLHNFSNKIMLLEWGLILSVTSVSVTMLMMVGTFFAILPEAEEFYG